MPYRLLEHTADLGIEATGATREEALQWAALGIVHVVTGRPQPNATLRPERELSFFVEAPDLPALVVAFLSDVLWHLESEDLLWLGGGVALGNSRDGIHRLDAMGNACKYKPERDGRGVEVKAVTYHDLQFRREGAGWLLRVYLDL